MSVQWDELEFLIKQTCKILVCVKKLDRANTPTHAGTRTHTHTHTHAWGFLTVSLLLTTQTSLLKGQNTDLILWIFPLNLSIFLFRCWKPLRLLILLFIRPITLILSFLFFRQPLACSRPEHRLVPNSCRTRNVLYLSDFSLAQRMFYREKRIPMPAQLACSWTFCGFVKAIKGFAHLQNHILGLHEGGVEAS